MHHGIMGKVNAADRREGFYCEICDHRSRRNRRDSGILYDESGKRCYPDRQGKASEIDGLVYEVVRMGQKYHVPMPMYEKVAEKLKETIG